MRRDEVGATNDFIRGILAVANSILRGSTPEQVAAMQVKMEQAVDKANALEELMAVAMDTSAGSVFAGEELDDRKLEELAGQMTSEAQAEEGAAYDAQISQGLKKIEEEMRKEL